MSIIDLSASGRMPLFNETKTIAVIQNGEIYNFKHLRREFEAKGHRFGVEFEAEDVAAGKYYIRLKEGDAVLQEKMVKVE